MSPAQGERLVALCLHWIGLIGIYKDKFDWTIKEHSKNHLILKIIRSLVRNVVFSHYSRFNPFDIRDHIFSDANGISEPVAGKSRLLSGRTPTWGPAWSQIMTTRGSGKDLPPSPALKGFWAKVLRPDKGVFPVIGHPKHSPDQNQNAQKNYSLLSDQTFSYFKWLLVGSNPTES